MAEDKKKVAAAQRSDYLRALEEELVAVERSGKPESRVKAVKAEIARVKKAPTGRAAADDSVTA